MQTSARGPSLARVCTNYSGHPSNDATTSSRLSQVVQVESFTQHDPRDHRVCVCVSQRSCCPSGLPSSTTQILYPARMSL